MVSCSYDMNIIEAKSVLMTFYNGWLKKNVDVTFDFETGTTSSNSYQFYAATDFTFIADLTVNDTTSVRGVTFFVYTNQDEVRQLQGFFDKTQNRWVAVSKFDSNNLPVNLAVDVDYYTNIVADRQELDDRIMAFKANLDEEKAILEELDNSFDVGDDDGEKSIYEKMYEIATSANINEAELQSLINQLSSAPSIDSELSDEELDAEFQELMEEMEESMKHFEKDSIYAAYNVNGNLRDVYFPTPPYSGTLSIDDLNELFTIEPVVNLNEVELVQMGYDVLETTDGTKVYCLVTDSEVSYIDTKEGVKYTLIHRNQLHYLVEKSSNSIKKAKGTFTDIPFYAKIDEAWKLIDWLQKTSQIPNENLTEKILEDVTNNYQKLSTLINQIYKLNYKWVESSWTSYLSSTIATIDGYISKNESLIILHKKRLFDAHRAHCFDPTNQKLLDKLVRELEKTTSLEKSIKRWSFLKTQVGKIAGVFKKAWNAIPKTPKIEPNYAKLGGKMIGGFGVFMELSDLISFINNTCVEDTRSWYYLLHAINEKIPCPKSPEEALRLQKNITWDAGELLKVLNKNIFAKFQAIKADIVSLFMPELPPAELVVWFASGILNSYSEWSKYLTIDKKFLDKRISYYYAINNLQCREREPNPPSGGGGSNGGNNGER